MPYVPTPWIDGVTDASAANMNKIEAQLVRLSHVFNVREYGAVGDGVADDTVAIQEAIDACQAANGGVVFLPDGFYKTSAPLRITQHHVTLQGTGHGIGFDPTPGTRGPCVIQPTSAAAFTGSAVIRVGQAGTPTGALHGIVLRGFTIAGYGLPANAKGIYAEVTWSLISEIRIENVTSHAMHFRSANGAHDDGCFNDIFHNYIENGTGDGIFMEDAPDNRITENLIIEPTGNGINAAAAGLMIQNNLIACGGKAVIGDIYDTKVIGNRIEGCNGGVYLSGNFGYGGFQVVGNKLWNCSRAADNATDSINVTAIAAVHGAGVISGNSFWTNEASGGTPPCNRARYHINIAHANVQEAVIGPNSYGYNNATRSYGTAAINNDGTRTQIAPIVLAQSAVASPGTGSTGVLSLALVTVPGGLMGKNGRLRITSLWSMTNNANSKSIFVSLDGTAFYAVGVSSIRSLQLLTTIANRGAQNSQVGAPSDLVGPGSNGTAPTTAAIDTSVDQQVKLEIILANGADTVTLESYSVEVLPG